MLSMMDIDECSCMIRKEEEEEEEEEMVEVLPAEDLIVEILLRLPPVSVIKFKHVCKSWYSLISNPVFLKDYHHHPQRLLDNYYDDILLISTVEDKKHNPAHEYVHLPTQTQTQNQQQLKVFLDHALSVFIPQKFSSSSSHRLIDSCNGLLLYRTEYNTPISGDGDGDGDGDETTRYHVFNPITKQCFELPMTDRFGNNFRKGFIYWLHIVFDPSVSVSFKVVICFAPDHNIVDSGIYVYSSSSESETSSSWKYLTKFFPCSYRFYNQFRAVLLDGFLYLYKCSFWLLCFDVVKDKIWFLRLSRTGTNKFHLLYFGKCGGRLQLIRRDLDDRSRGRLTWPFSFHIRELELELEGGHDHDHDQPNIRNWTVKFQHYVSIHLKYEDYIPLTAHIIHIYRTGAAAGKKKGEDEDEELLFLNGDRNAIISYNFRSETFGKEQNIPDFDRSHDLHAFPYSPTLFPFSC